MITFKKLLKKINKNKTIEHDFPSSFKEVLQSKKRKIKQHSIHESEDSFENWANTIDANKEYSKTHSGDRPFSEFCNGMHNIHHEMEPQHLTDEQKRTIRHFTFDGSANEKNTGSSLKLNQYVSGNLKLDQNDPSKKEFDRHLKNFDDMFDEKRNLNSKPLTVYSGIPPSVAEKIKRNPNSLHKFRRFTSTSTSPRAASFFSKTLGWDEDSDDGHMLEIKMPKRRGLSIAMASKWKNLNEIVLHHKTKYRYRGSRSLRNQDGSFTHIHTMEAI